MTEKEYRADKRLSQSDLIQMKKSPKKWKLGIKDEPTRQMIFGSYFHDLVLEQDLSHYNLLTDELINEWFNEYKADKKNKSTIDNYSRTSHYKDKLKELEGIVIDQSDIDLANKMLSNIDKSIFENGIKEQPIFFEFDLIDFKGKPDFYNDDVLIDLKTISSLDKINTSIQNYLMQAGLYWYGLSQQDNKFRKVEYYFVETSFPYDTAKIEIPQKALEIGLAQAREILNEIYLPIQQGTYTNDKVYEVPNWLEYKYLRD